MGVLGQLGDVRVVEVLIRGLKDPDHRVQANSIEGLERVGIYKTMSLIVPFLRDRNPRLRANAAKAVYSFGNVVGLRALREMMSDPDVEARSSAAWALGEIKGVEAMKILIAAAQSEADEAVKKSIYRALLKIRKSREKAVKPEGT
jgi:HEAT repeat protein